MTSNLTKIAAGTSMLGVAGLSGAALAPRNAEPERPAGHRKMMGGNLVGGQRGPRVIDQLG